MTEAVVLIHGLGGSARSFDRLAPLLERRFRVLAPDLPGFGGTPPPADGDYSMPACAAHVRGVLADAGVTDVKVVGHSMGGSIAVALAEAEPGLVRRLVLVNAPPSVESRLTARSGSERLIRMPVVGRVAWALANDSRRRAGLESSMAPGHPVPDQFVADLKATTHAAFAGSTIAIDRYLGERTLPTGWRAFATRRSPWSRASSTSGSIPARSPGTPGCRTSRSRTCTARATRRSGRCPRRSRPRCEPERR